MFSSLGKADDVCVLCGECVCCRECVCWRECVHWDVLSYSHEAWKTILDSMWIWEHYNTVPQKQCKFKTPASNPSPQMETSSFLEVEKHYYTQPARQPACPMWIVKSVDKRTLNHSFGYNLSQSLIGAGGKIVFHLLLSILFDLFNIHGCSRCCVNLVFRRGTLI